MDKHQEDLQLRYGGDERVCGQYDVLERQCQIIKKEHNALEKSKVGAGDSKDDDDDAS